MVSQSVYYSVCLVVGRKQTWSSHYFRSPAGDGSWNVYCLNTYKMTVWVFVMMAKVEKAFLPILHGEIYLQRYGAWGQPVTPWMHLIRTEQRTYWKFSIVWMFTTLMRGKWGSRNWMALSEGQLHFVAPPFNDTPHTLWEIEWVPGGVNPRSYIVQGKTSKENNWMTKH